MSKRLLNLLDLNENIFYEMSEEITPIIIIGMIRTGTKWLSNVLCNNSEIAGIQLKKARGIQETNMFGGFQYKFDLSSPDEYIGLIELWSQTDFFKETGLQKEFFYHIKPRPQNFIELYRLLMNEYAISKQKRFWLQKTGPVWGEKLIKFLPDAKYVLIKRNVVDTIQSTLQLYENKRKKKTLFKSVFMYSYQLKIMKNFFKSTNCLWVDYDDMKSNLKDQILRICEYIGIPFHPDMLRDRYPKNSSFVSELQRKAILTKFDILKIQVLVKIFNIVPLVIMRFVVVIIELKNFLKGKNIPLIPGTFSRLKHMYDIA